MKIVLTVLSLIFLVYSLEASLIRKILKDVDGILDDNELSAFKEFKAKFKKSCTDESADCKEKKRNFAKNLKKFNELKEKKKSFEVKMRPDMDKSDEERHKKLMKLSELPPLPPPAPWERKMNRTSEKRRPKRQVPGSYDWRDEGVVTSVKNQGDCMSCWTFAAIAAVETLDNWRNCRFDAGSHYDYSEQLTLDCTYYNTSLTFAQQENRCSNGGFPKDAFNRIIKSGTTTEAGGPYFNPPKMSPCKQKPVPSIKPISAIVDLTDDVGAMLDFLYFTAPITTCFMVCDDFDSYASGVYDNPECNGDTSVYAHAMAIVGYGTDDETGLDYWLCKNSYGDGWGDEGYVKMRRGTNNCQMESWSVVGPDSNQPYGSCFE